MRKFAVHLILAASQIVLATQALGQATCDIEPQKRHIIESVLCSQGSSEKAYQQSGSGCFERSVTKRLEDSAAQIFMFEKCVDSGFALELQEATIRAMGFMEELSVCVEEKVDLDAILRDRMAFIRGKASTLDCSIRIRSQLHRRRPAFEEMIQQSSEISRATILKNLGVVVDRNGNVSDR
jgi:hypothetical protein